MPPTPATRRRWSERIKRVMRHPIQTIRESRSNRQNREWEIYYAAAKEIGSSERNARLFADEISGKALMRSRLKKLVKPTLEPYAKRIRERQDGKERLLLESRKNRDTGR